MLEASRISQDSLVIFGLAEIEMNLELFQDAIKHYAQLDNREILEETGISTYERIGRAYAGLGKFEAAIEFLKKLLRLNSMTKRCLKRLFFFMTKKNTKEPISTLSSWIL